MLVKNHPLLKSISLLTNCSFVIFDHVTPKYAYVDESITKINGFDKESFCLRGWEFFANEVVVPDYLDFAINSHRIIFEYLYSLPLNLRNQVIFSKDYLCYNSKGKIHRILQKGMVLQSDAKGNIQLTLHLIENISHLKKLHSANLIITGPKEEHQLYFYNDNTDILTHYGNLSKREIGLLRLLALGMETKEIATKLNISPHTVDTHRRNILSKLNCVDTTALVSYSKMVHII